MYVILLTSVVDTGAFSFFHVFPANVQIETSSMSS